jgi:hypothetical protein
MIQNMAIASGTKFEPCSGLSIRASHDQSPINLDRHSDDIIPKFWETYAWNIRKDEAAEATRHQRGCSPGGCPSGVDAASNFISRRDAPKNYSPKRDNRRHCGGPP